MQAITDPKAIRKILNEKVQGTPRFLHESSVVFQSIVEHSDKNFLLSGGNSFLALIIPHQSGKDVHTLFLINNGQDFQAKTTIQAVKYVNKIIKGVKAIWVQNIPLGFSAGLLSSKCSSFKIFSRLKGSKCLKGDSYQLESNFGQVIYNIENIEWKNELILYGNNSSSFKLIEGPDFSSLRYLSNRLRKKYQKLRLIDNPDLEMLLSCIYEWKEEMNFKFKNSIEINSIPYRKKHYIKFWFRPIIDFVSFSYKLNFAPPLIKRFIYSNSGDKGFWIGYVHDDSMIVTTFISNRKSTLFADVLLLDVINYSIDKNIKYINLGGSEDSSLFNFKSKYVRAFEGSFIRETDSLLFKKQ